MRVFYKVDKQKLAPAKLPHIILCAVSLEKFENYYEFLYLLAISILCYINPYVGTTVKPVKKKLLSKRPKIVFQDQLSLSVGQKYLTFIKLLFVIKFFVLSILSGCFTQVLL